MHGYTNNWKMSRKISDSTVYVGVDDLQSELFESQYIIPEGIAYNSYLILDDKVAVLDTVDAIMASQWLEKLSAALGDRTPDYLVVHHMEPDHAGSVKVAMERYPGMTLVASAKAIHMLPQFFEDLDIAGRTLEVKEGDRLELGTHSLQFLAAPMVHWPEVLVSFDESEGALYSADAFGKFGALSRCGFYGRDDEDWTCEGRRYYFNIVGKFGAPVQTLLSKAAKLPIRTIRPLHGPVLEDNLNYYLSLYDTWSRYEPETEGVFIAYASIHGHTAVAAHKLADMLEERGVSKVVVSDICRSDIAENVEDAFRYPKMVLAASSYDGGLFSPMSDFLYRLGMKNYSNRTVAVIENGSWAPSAARVMKESLGKMKNVTVLEPSLTIMSSLKQSDLPALARIADALV